MKYEKQFRIAHPETVGEADSHFDLSNYADWLDNEYDEAVHQRDELRERCKQLEFMIEKGLGWDDMKNDITMPHEL